MLDDNKAVDFTAQEDVQKSRIVAEGDASIRLAVGTEHVRMCKYPGAAEHVAVANRSETNRAYPVEIGTTTSPRQGNARKAKRDDRRGR